MPGDSSPGSPPSPPPLPGPDVEAAAPQERDHHHHAHHTGGHLALADLGLGRGGKNGEVETSEAAHLLLGSRHEEDPQPPGGGGRDGLTELLPTQRGALRHLGARVPGLQLEERLETMTWSKTTSISCGSHWSREKFSDCLRLKSRAYLCCSETSVGRVD